jgi:hypothetical protein
MPAKEQARFALLYGVSSWRAHFACIHGQWCNVPRPLIDDLWVALANTIWSGKRDLKLEQRIAAEIGQAAGEDMWVAFQRLNELIEPIAADGDRRLAWQAHFSAPQDMACAPNT